MRSAMCTVDGDLDENSQFRLFIFNDNIYNNSNN